MLLLAVMLMLTVDATRARTLDDAMIALRAIDQVDARESHNADLERCAADFWQFAQYVQTRDEDDQGRIRPFPLDWPYLQVLIAELNSDEPVLVIPKSRRMIVTTTIDAWTLWRMMFTDRTAGDLWSACVISINEKKSKQFVARMVEIHSLLPGWLQKSWETATQLDRSIAGGGSLEAIHAGGSGPRGEGYAVGIMDESGFQTNARENYRALRQCARKTVEVSSANGRGNHFDEMWDDRTVRVLELHYSKHPERVPGTVKGDAWKTRAMVGQTKADWAREQEMDRDVYATVGYYGSDWTRDVVGDCEWDGVSIVTIGMDYSYLHPAAVVSHLNAQDQWCRYWEYLLSEVTLERFCPLVFTETLQRFPKARFRVAPDPFRGRQTKGDADAYGNPATDLATITEYARKILGQDTLVSIEQTGHMLRPEGHRRVRRGFVRRADGRYGTVIHPRCKNLIQGFGGAYGPKEGATESQLSNEEPDGERLQVHVMDADRYGFCEFTVQDLGVEFQSGRPATSGLVLAQRARQRALAERESRGI